jgi:hypothetical protein
MSSSSGPQRGLSRVIGRVGALQDYLWVGAIAAAYLYLFVRILWRIGDEGDMLNGALAVSEGRVPYRDFFDLRGPASFYWLGLFFKVFGATWFIARTHLLMTGTLTAVLVYHLARRVHRSAGALFPCAMVTVMSLPSWPASHHHWDSNLFALAAVAAFFHALDSDARRWFFLTGAFAGMTSCFIYQKGFLLLVSFIGIVTIGRVFFRRRAALTDSVALLVGYCAIGAGVLAWFIHLGALQDLIDATIRFPLNTYADQNRLPYAYQLSWLAFGKLPSLRVLPAFVALPAATLLLVPAIIFGLLPFVVVALACFYATGRPAMRREAFAVIAYSLIGFALWFSETHRPDIMHLIYGSPVLVIASWLLWRELEWPRVMRATVPAVLIGSVLFVAGVQAWGAAAANQRTPSRRGTVVGFDDDEALRFLVSDQVRAGDFVFVYPYFSTYYFLADVRNPTPFGEMIYEPGSKHYFDDAIEALERHQVKFILWDTVMTAENMQQWFPAYEVPPERERWMENYFREHYDEIGVLNRFRLLRRKSG